MIYADDDNVFCVTNTTEHLLHSSALTRFSSDMFTCSVKVR